MKKKIYLIHPSYRDQDGRLLKGKRLYVYSLALPALSGAIPDEWEKEFCLEYFADVNLETDASVVGISCMGYELFRGIELAKEFRARGKIVLFGGFQPHMSREFVGPHVDAVVHGNPGRSVMSQILRDAEQGTLQKDYSCTPDLNFPFDYSVLDMRRTVFPPVLMGVGCRNRCSFCCIGSVYRGKYTLRKARYVLDDLEYLHQRTRRIAFVDTNIYNNRGYIRFICREMINRRYRFIWGADATIDIGDDPETLTLLHDAGCRLLFVGMETVEQDNLDAVNKKQDVSSYRRRIKAIHAAGIRIAGFFIYGLDNDTVETAARLSRFIIDTRIAAPLMNTLVPMPGTPVYEELKREGRLLMSDEQDFLRNNITYNSSFNLCFYVPKHMTPHQVESGFLDLLRSLSGYTQIVRRSITTNPSLSFFLLYMNWVFRREYLQLRRRINAARR